MAAAPPPHVAAAVGVARGLVRTTSTTPNCLASYQLLGWDSPTHRALDVLDTDRLIALARRREAVSELELAPAHVRMLTTDVRLRKLSSQKCVLGPDGCTPDVLAPRGDKLWYARATARRADFQLQLHRLAEPNGV